jgi:hypothetical protein
MAALLSKSDEVNLWNIVDILENEDDEEAKHERHFDNFLSHSWTYLHLSYPGVRYDFDGAGYDELFDYLNDIYSIYELVDNLYIETDFINRIPANVMKFVNLEKLTITGSRFWDLNMTQVPPSVTKLDLTEHSNLSTNCIIGMEKLTNLEELVLDGYPFDLGIFTTASREDRYEKCGALANLPSLKEVAFKWGGVWPPHELVDGWKDVIIKHEIFSNIKSRIKHSAIEITDDELLTINLSDVESDSSSGSESD